MITVTPSTERTDSCLSCGAATWERDGQPATEIFVLAVRRPESGSGNNTSLCPKCLAGLRGQLEAFAPVPPNERAKSYRLIGYTEGIRDAARLVDDDAGFHTTPWLTDQILGLLDAR